MPIFPTLQGDLSRFTSTPSPSTDIQKLVETFLKAGQLKKKTLGEQRTQSIVEALLSGGDISTALQPEQPTEPTSGIGGFMQGLGELFSGGKQQPGLTDIEKSIATAAAKNRFTPPFTRGAILKLEGQLKSGGKTDIWGRTEPFANRKEAIKHAERTIGPDWETLSPRSKEMIDINFPEDIVKEGKKKVARPSPTDKGLRSEAIKHLKAAGQLVTEGNIKEILRQLQSR